MDPQSSSTTIARTSLPSPPAVACSAVALLGGGAWGGLPGLQAAFTAAGLADRFDSWVGSGDNLAVTAEQIERALGPSLASMAAATGQHPARLAAGLATLLPEVVDRLTPAGQLPAPGRGGGLRLLARLLFARRRPRSGA